MYYIENTRNNTPFLALKCLQSKKWEKKNKDWHGSCLYSYDNSKEKLHLWEKSRKFYKEFIQNEYQRNHIEHKIWKSILSGGKIKISDCILEVFSGTCSYIK